MKRIVLAAIFLCSCGGGGGGYDGPTCETYCAYACNKGGQCFGFTRRQVDQCEYECVMGTDRNGRSNESCGEAQYMMQDMTCLELAITLGLVRTGGSSD